MRSDYIAKAYNEKPQPIYNSKDEEVKGYLNKGRIFLQWDVSYEDGICAM
ncbi:MAG: hypothetical protein MJ134_09510 [Lachnospiraceae bacterium]|nr:hypothetical protein [Lachnospiraceae bacterium]